MLQSGNGQNADGLARQCGVSRRTVFRDLDALRNAGVPIAFDPRHDRYSIPIGFYLPPVNFTAAEALSLMALANEMGRSDRLPFYESAHAAAVKLEGSLPPALRERLRVMIRAIRIQPSPVGRMSDKESFYQKLIDARALRRVVQIQYDSKTEWERITTKLRTYQLLFCRHSWYVIGRSSYHTAVRTFNVSRIVSLEMLANRYSVPRRFSLERHLGNAWQMIPGEGADHHVAIRFKPLVAGNVRRRSTPPLTPPL